MRNSIKRTISVVNVPSIFVAEVIKCRKTAA
jgi:hypothetical protein